MTIFQFLINSKRRRMNRLFFFLSYHAVLSSKAAEVLLTHCVRICLLTLHGVNKRSERTFGKRQKEREYGKDLGRRAKDKQIQSWCFG